MLTVTGILIGLVVWTVTQQQRIAQLEDREQEHPTRRELAEVAIKVDSRITGLEKHVEDLDLNGTRALSSRTTLIEQANHTQDERIQEFARRLDEMQASINKIADLFILVQERQRFVIERLKQIEEERRPHGP